jgi:CO dehydrogenase/acetyl-CoA synthase epsilon subunit
MKKIALFSLMVVAVMGMITSRAQGDGDTSWDVTVYIVNSAETPVSLSLANNNDAKAAFPSGGSTFILQPGQFTSLYAENKDPKTIASLQWNIIYNFYDGDSINQRISSVGAISGPNANCASPSQSGLFAVSTGTFVDATFTNNDVGNEVAAWMGLSGTAENIVGNLIDLGMELAGINAPSSSSENLFYAITIGQNDYNTDKLAGVDWSSFDPGYSQQLPPVTFIERQQIFQYDHNSWNNSGNLAAQSMIADFSSANVSIGMKGNLIANYGVNAGTYQILNYIEFPTSNQSVVQVSRNPNGPQCMAALGDSSVWYSDGVNVTKISGSVGSGILQMSVNWGGWNGAGWPQTLLGLASGYVFYCPPTSAQSILGGLALNSSIMRMEAFWDDAGIFQVVAGLGNGDIYWWNGTSWLPLYSPTGYAPVYQLHARFTAGGVTPPQVLATVFDGSIFYLDGYALTPVMNAGGNYCILDVAPASNGTRAFTFPTFLAGFKDGSVGVYDGAAKKWYEIKQANDGGRIQFLSGNWSDLIQSAAAVDCVYSQNFYFTYHAVGGGSDYPAIPDVSSVCGDIDLDGKGDIISVEGSSWYAWLSSNQYSKRYGPYDIGVLGKPVIGDFDGDGQPDLIMVHGSNWYILTSSSGYTKRIDLDLGIYGEPLTGDIDGDGKDDAIVVRGSQWYVWTSSSGYTKRLGPYDLGIKGLAAAGDIDGDGKADLVIAVGSNWYTWSSASKHLVRSGPYNMGISGTPKIADIDGDGLADLIVIVGSDWYVWFSSAGYQRFGPYTMNLP